MFFPSTVIEWNKLDQSIKNSTSISIFKQHLLRFIRPSGNSVFNCQNTIGVKFLTRLRLGLSHLREHKFKHSFLDTLNPICICGNDIETTSHYLLHCPNYFDERQTLLNTLKDIDVGIFYMNDT